MLLQVFGLRRRWVPINVTNAFRDSGQGKEWVGKGKRKVIQEHNADRGSRGRTPELKVAIGSLRTLPTSRNGALWEVWFPRAREVRNHSDLLVHSLLTNGTLPK